MEKLDEPDKSEEEQCDGSQEEKAEAQNDLNTPYNTCHNIDDLKLLDFNSADEVRQAMKSVLGERCPCNNDVEESLLASEKADKILPTTIPDSLPIEKNIQSRSRFHTNKNDRVMFRSHNKRSNDGEGASWRRRSGRPPKAGPSRARPGRRQDISALYVGKLSNVLLSRRRHRRPKRLW